MIVGMLSTPHARLGCSAACDPHPLYPCGTMGLNYNKALLLCTTATTTTSTTYYRTTTAATTTSTWYSAYMLDKREKGQRPLTFNIIRPVDIIGIDLTSGENRHLSFAASSETGRMTFTTRLHQDDRDVQHATARRDARRGVLVVVSLSLSTHAAR